MFTRIAEQHIQNRLAKKRRKPLVPRGARQVGKSTLVRLFAEKAGLELREMATGLSRDKENNLRFFHTVAKRGARHRLLAERNTGGTVTGNGLDRR